MRVDLNCDLGESFGIYRLGDDEAVMRAITSANVACGFHGGDPATIRRTIRLARECGVAVGAHPGLPDLAGFGRREMSVTPEEVEDMVLYQIGAVSAFAAAEGVELQHVKPHGALSNMAARDVSLATAIARAIAAFDPSLIFFCVAGSTMVGAARELGLQIASEAFADRAYQPDGSLASRSLPRSVLHDPDEVAERATRMVKDRTVVAMNGSVLRIDADTICVHGDNPQAVELTTRLRHALERAGIRIEAPRSGRRHA